MSLPAKLRKVSEFYGLVDVRDWQSLTAADVLVIPDVGAKTLDKLRLYLAHKNLSLSKDHSPEYWITHLSGLADGDDQPIEKHGICPFTILIDSNETFPWTFETVTDSNGNPVEVPTRREALWTRGLADYTIAGFEDQVAIERKEDDLFSSLAQRRENFEAEVARLDATMDFAAIIVSTEWSGLSDIHYGHGCSLKSAYRTMVSWMVRYPSVHWAFVPGRAAAEQLAYDLLEKFWHHKTMSDSRLKRNARILDKLREKV